MITYLDCAATSFPKPPKVTDEMCRCMREYCGNPGRGSHIMALRASEVIYKCRESACELFGCPSPENAVLTLNATHALNIAIMGLVPEGSHVIISDMEHNSVLRPVEYLKRTKGVSYSVFSTKGDIGENIRRLITPKTSAVICNHSSNIINRTLPQAEIGELCRNAGILFILDASQSAGVHDINMERDGISALCFPGHKGLLGPEGCGMALFYDGVIPRPLMYGGSGVNSEEISMPDFLPDRLEAGTMSAPCAAGLLEGIKYVKNRKTRSILLHEKSLTDRLFDRYENSPLLTVYGERGGGLFLFTVKDQTPQKTGALLNEHGICVRTGLHCAPLAHKTVGTPPGGAVRLSVGPLTLQSDILRFIHVMDKYILS
ncbi:MAG: aminotransferase class V-fold PLP-dependent enzyme [Clostridia bacterium]|nr:aminotransferase class V-fold PLP-dependent enzyme [Clostridia bacterium]